MVIVRAIGHPKGSARREGFGSCDNACVIHDAVVPFVVPDEFIDPSKYCVWV
jgi:hypothetical protein